MCLLFAFAAVIFVSIAAWSQEAIIVDGSPSVRFTDPTNRNKFTLVKRQELPTHTLLFKANDFSQGGMFTGCKGDLRISAERVQFQPRCSGHPFDEPTSSVINANPRVNDPMRVTIA